MNVTELRERLEAIEAAGGGDAPVVVDPPGHAIHGVYDRRERWGHVEVSH